MIGLFFGRHAINRKMDALLVVPAEPFCKRLPCSPWVLIEFFINRAVYPFHFAVPVRRFLRDEEVWDMLCFAPRMKVASKFAPVVCLNGDDRKIKVSRRPLDREDGIFTVSGRKYLRETPFRERIENGELILALAMRVHILHIKLDTFSGLRDHKRFLERRVPTEFPLRSANQSFPLVITIDDRA